MIRESGKVVKDVKENLHLPDSHARHGAVTASGINVVVTAGAGTGKTSLLIDRILHLLTRRDQPLSLTQIVAVTFTNKAASELKLRVRQRLRLMKELARASMPGINPTVTRSSRSGRFRNPRVSPTKSWRRSATWRCVRWNGRTLKPFTVLQAIS